MKNNLESLNNYLFEELERLNDDDELDTDEKLEKEIKRSKAITNVARSITDNANTILEARKFAYETGKEVELPKMLTNN